MRWLLLSLALQNLGRRKARSLLLIAAVALGSGVVFTGAVLMQSIDRSMAVGFTRLGADMMVVPEGALTNITAALLTVEPTDLVLDADAIDKAITPEFRQNYDNSSGGLSNSIALFRGAAGVCVGGRVRGLTTSVIGERETKRGRLVSADQA